MTHPYIEHPYTVGAQNKHVLDTAANGYAAALALAEQGFVIEKMIVEGHQPVIFVQSTLDIRTRLGGGLHIVRPNETGGRDEIYATQYKQCQVQWRKS